MKRLAIWLLIIAVVAGGGYFAYVKTRPVEKPLYRTEKAGTGDITMSVTATGTLSAVTTVLVGSQVSGIIAKLYADFNSRVTKGQLLAELDPVNFLAAIEQRQADLTQAEVQMRNNKVTFERQQRLLAEGLSAQGDFDTAKANYDSSVATVAQNRAALEQAQTQLKYSKIVSPIDGVVVDRQYDVGQTVAASFQAPTLFTIAQDLTRMQCQADVDQSDIGRVQVGQVARFTVDAFPDREFQGTIKQIRLNATVSQNVITYPVIIEVNNPDERLRPKMTADITIEVATVRNVLRVSNAALRFRPADAAATSGRTTGGTATTGGQAGPGNGAAGSGTPAAGSAPAQAATSGGGSAGGRNGGYSRRGESGAGGAGTAVAVAGGPGAPAGAGGAGAGGNGGAGDARRRGKSREQTVYVLEAAGTLKPISIRSGITDGRFTEVAGGELKAGDVVVVGMPTTKADQTGRTPGMGRF